MDNGPSVVGRIGALLRALTSLEPAGSSTTAIATAVALPRPTAHRLLTALRQEGLVDRDEATGEWHLGAECFPLGAAATNRHDITPVARESVLRIARETGESAFFSVRRGDETVCLLREDGSFPIRSHVLHEGIRFLLGVASAGMVILAFLHEREREAYLERADLEGRYGDQHSTALLRDRVTATGARLHGQSRSDRPRELGSRRSSLRHQWRAPLGAEHHRHRSPARTAPPTRARPASAPRGSCLGGPGHRHERCEIDRRVARARGQAKIHLAW